MITLAMITLTKITFAMTTSIKFEQISKEPLQFH
jgi:hypothetical protein